jgi:signal transduction histidine kinase/CheY-like chemotaxis protein
LATSKLSAASATPTDQPTRRSVSPDSRFREAHLKLPALIAAIALVYFAAGKAGLYFASFSASSTAVWPATGVAFAALLLLGLSLWPAIFIGAFLVNLTTAGTVFTALGIATGNTLEAVVAAYLTIRFAHGRKVFESSQDFFRFVGAGLLAAAISATAGLASLALGGLAPVEAFSRIWLTWWVGDVGSFLIVAPVIILCIEGPRVEKDRRQQIEVWLTLAAITLVGLLVFGGAFLGLQNYPLGFLGIPILVWAAFRFGQREAAAATFILAASADWGMKHGHGPWARFDDPLRAVILPQLFMITMAVMTLAMAAVVWERKRAEAEANEANRAKDRFLAMLGHELRNPIAALSSAANLLERGEVKGREAQRLVEIILRQSQQLARMVDDLLDMGRAAAGKITLDKRPMNLGACARASVATLRMREEYAARNISTQIEDLWIDGDPNRIDQILSNLLSNALIYTPAKGRVVLSVRAEDDRAALCVEDEGEGISLDLLPRVFDLFVQGDQGPNRPRGGLGIGLSLVRRMVELHGGTVEAHSAGLGRGSTFKVLIPRIEAVQETAKIPNAPPKAETCRRILIVEDNGDVRESLRLVLEIAGHKILEADSGLSGVASAIANRPDVALIDIGLPGIDGYEVARRIRSASAAQEIMLIALTGYGLPEDRLKAKDAGFDAHLVKPVNLERLDELLSQSKDSGTSNVGLRT